MGKNFKGSTPILTDVPKRLFDLVSHFAQKYSYKDCMFAGKENGKWVKYDGKKFCELTDYVCYGLLKIGIQKGDRIIIAANNCPEWNILDFAIQKVGAICIPVYPTISHDDYEYIFKHSEAKAIFVGSKLLYSKIKDIINNVKIECVFSIQKIEGIQHFSELLELGRANADYELLKNISEGIDTNDVATIIYTSGTMGTPKGVMLSHRNILSVVEYLCPLYPIDESHDALSYLPLSHIYERTVQYCRIYLGVSIYYAESIGAIVDNLKEIKPQHFSSVPRLIEKIYSTILRKGSKLKGLKRIIFFWSVNLAGRYDETGRNNGLFYLMKLRIADKLVFKEWRKALGNNLQLIITGGAAINPKLVKTFSAIGIPLSEGYGLTETSPVICTNSMVTGKLKAGTVGEVLKNQEIKIGDNNEILVKGPNVMLGYYKAEDMTREAIDGDGFFHTGDVGTIDEDNMLHITGRIKEIFKTSMGKYVSPALIENKLTESQFINQVMVVGEGQKFAAALIVPNFEHVRSWCNIKGVEYTTDEQMVKEKIIIDRFRKEVDKYNKTLGDFEQIKKLELLPKEWNIDDGYMTASLKLRRTRIIKDFGDIIEKIYAE